MATCDNLQSIYAPKVEQNKTNLDYLKQVISVMQMLGCTEQEAYFAASEHAHAIEPTFRNSYRLRIYVFQERRLGQMYHIL